MLSFIPKRWFQIFIWVSGFLYGTVKSVADRYFYKVQKILYGDSRFTIYVSDEKDRSLKITKLEKLNNSIITYDKYYLHYKISDGFENIEKVLVFDDKQILLDKITNIEYLVSLEREKFGKYLEISVNKNRDITTEFLKYTSDSGFFQNITQYSLKASDLFCFNSNSFLVNPQDKLLVTKMDFETTTYNYSDIIGF
jgi:hypothetical protein